MKTPLVTVKSTHDEVVDFPLQGEVTEMMINGEKIIRIHELAKRLDRITKRFYVSCLVLGAGFLTLAITMVYIVPSHEQAENAFRQIEALFGNLMATPSQGIDK